MTPVPLTPEPLFDRLGQSASFIVQLTETLDTQEAQWRPDVRAWSILEIVNHLADEEREDFRCRLDLTLHHPEKPWPPIDPESWAKERCYRDRDLRESLGSFREERQDSLRWLRSLPSPDWERQRSHPVFGDLSAGDLLCSWVAHDHLHLRQLIQRRFQFAQMLGKPYRTHYAGNW